MNRLSPISTLLLAPFRDLLTGLDQILLRGRVGALALVLLGLSIGWWIYVPTHELLHVAGCLVSGGSVETLEVAPIYGGALLARVFPFVEAGGEYAGRLSEFDPNGTLGYLITDLAPYLMTLLPGFTWLRFAARREGRAWSLAWGAGLPFALAPLLSITGDAYEIGSLIVTSLPAFAELKGALVSDDVFLLLSQGLTSGQLPAFGLSSALALVWAWGSIALSAKLATLLGQPPLSPVNSSRKDPLQQS